jgi:hypothetical protein
MLSAFLKAAFPHVPDNLLQPVSAELEQALARPDIAVLKHQIDSLQEKLGAAEDEIHRLRQESISYRLGIKNATNGGLELLAEHARAKSEEGYTDQHDDAHDDLQLISKAIAYLQDILLREQGLPGFNDTPPDYWPGKPEEWKPKATIVRQTVVAGGLLISSIDRKKRLRIDHL